MSNKSWEKLSDIDRRLQRLFPTIMWDNNETICTIRLFGGFELFNTRPYHNYETWSSGYEITTGERYGNIRVVAEDLDDAIGLLEEKLIEKENK
jgi:hypothetical protein